MSRGLGNIQIQEGEIFKDKSGLEVKVARIDANHRIRFSVISDQSASAGPGEMSYESFIRRFCDYKHDLPRRKAA